MKRPAAVSSLIALSLLGGLGARSLLKRPHELVLAGTIEARDVSVGSLVGGRVVAVHTDEGQDVTAGQPLVTLEPDLLDLSLLEQRQRVAEAEARLALVVEGPRREETQRARVEWEQAETERARLERLLGEGVIGRQVYDTQAAAAASRRQLLDQLERGSRPAEVTAARAAVAREAARLGYLERQRKEAVITAPVAGVVSTMDLRPGDLVGANQPVAVLLEPSQLWVRVYVPEPRLAQVRLGQRAAVTVDTYPDRVFPAKVVEIRPRAEYTPGNVQTLEQRSDQVFGVKLAIEPPAATSPASSGAGGELKPGMAALATLEGVTAR